MKFTLDLYIAVILTIISLLMIYNFFKKDPVIEGMANVSGVTYEALQSLASMYKEGKLKVSELEVTGPATINGHITCKGGGDFSASEVAKRYLFSDYESGGKKLRVGNPWGVPGIYSEGGHLAMGSKDGDIYCGGKNYNHTSGRLFSAELNVSGYTNINGLTVKENAIFNKVLDVHDRLWVKNRIDTGVLELNNKITFETVNPQGHGDVLKLISRHNSSNHLLLGPQNGGAGYHIALGQGKAYYFNKEGRIYGGNRDDRIWG